MVKQENNVRLGDGEWLLSVDNYKAQHIEVFYRGRIINNKVLGIIIDGEL